MKRYALFILLFLATAAILLPAEPLTLKEAVDLARLQNEFIAIEQEKATEAQENALSAKSAFWPRISGQANFTQLSGVPELPLPPMPGFEMPEFDDKVYGFSVSVQQPIYLGGRASYGYKAASSMARAQRAQLAAQRNALVLEVANAYFGVIKADAFREAAREALAQIEGHLITVGKMYEAGLISRNDLLKVQVQLSNIQMMEVQAENAGTLARLALNMTLGVPLDTEFELTPESGFTYREPGDIDTEVEYALEIRQELISLEEMVEAARFGMRIMKNAYYPNIVAVGNAGGSRPGSTFDPEFGFSWDITVAATIELLSSGQRKHDILKANAQLRQVEIGLKQAKKGIELEVRARYAALVEAEKAIEIAGKKLEQAEEGYRVASAEFKEGLATNTDVLDASTALVQAKTEHVTALADYQVAQMKYEVSLGINPAEE